MFQLRSFQTLLSISWYKTSIDSWSVRSLFRKKNLSFANKEELIIISLYVEKVCGLQWTKCIQFYRAFTVQYLLAFTNIYLCENIFPLLLASQAKYTAKHKIDVEDDTAINAYQSPSSDMRQSIFFFFFLQNRLHPWLSLRMCEFFAKLLYLPNYTK